MVISKQDKTSSRLTGDVQNGSKLKCWEIKHIASNINRTSPNPRNNIVGTSFLSWEQETFFINWNITPINACLRGYVLSLNTFNELMFAVKATVKTTKTKSTFLSGFRNFLDIYSLYSLVTSQPMLSQVVSQSVTTLDITLLAQL